MPQWLTPHPYEGGDPWDRPARGISDRFAYAGWDDPMHEVCELVERGLHGRGIGDDVPVDQRTHKRLENEQKRDLRIHEFSVNYDTAELQRQRRKSASYRAKQPARQPTLTAEEREERRLARREAKLVEELKALGYVVFKMEGS